MKKLLFILFTFVSLNTFAQVTSENEKPYYYYLQLHPFAWLGGKDWRADICLDNYEPYIICDDNNEKMKFSGPMQIVNFLSKVGWELVTFENVNGQFFYVFRKLVLTDNDAKEGMNLLTEEEIKKVKKR